MCRYAKEVKVKEFIVATEIGIVHRLEKENQDKAFYPVLKLAIYLNMKLNNPKKIFWALEDMQHVIEVPEEISAKARKCIQKMFNFTE